MYRRLSDRATTSMLVSQINSTLSFTWMKPKPWNRLSVTRSGIPVNHPKRSRLEFERNGKMPTQEIPREQWNNFFNSFSRQHEGWLATLEVFATDAGAQQEVSDVPFEGISLDSDNDKSLV